eukprot:2288315-Alexandrium_andersonii.AAC.1
MPSNFAKQLMPQIPYAAILYVLIGCTPHAQDTISKIQETIQHPAFGLLKHGDRVPARSCVNNNV